MKRSKVITILKKAAREAGLGFEETELTRHSVFKVGTSSHTLGRHNEVDDITAVKFFKQYEDVLGKGWWRK